MILSLLIISKLRNLGPPNGLIFNHISSGFFLYMCVCVYVHKNTLNTSWILERSKVFLSAPKLNMSHINIRLFFGIYAVIHVTILHQNHIIIIFKRLIVSIIINPYYPFVFSSQNFILCLVYSHSLLYRVISSNLK